MNFVCIPSVHAGSRTLWASSRDDMVPFSRYWHRVHKRTDTPLHAVWLYTLLCIAINLVGLGSPILIAAVFNVCAIALNWSYCIPILCKMAFGKFERGPWHLGRFSTAINAWAVAWNAFLSALFVLPIIRPVTPENMNYASVVLAFVIAFLTTHWLLRGRKHYIGSRTQVRLANGEAAALDESHRVADQERVESPMSPVQKA